MTSARHRDIRRKIREIAIGIVALLTMMVTMSSTAAAQVEEIYAVRNFVGVNGLPLESFDMSFVDPTVGLYLLADRSNAAIDVLPAGTPTPTATTLGAGAFVGVASGGNTSGPNGVITANNHTEVWAGDGPSIDSVTGLSTSHVVVIDIASNVVTHKIDTGGVMRAGKLCEDPKDRLVLIANDDPQDLFLSFISTNKYEAIAKIKLDGSDPNGSFIRATNAINGIAQCQWNQFTGNFYVAVPEVGGPGDNSAAGAVLVIDPKKMKVQGVFPVDSQLCVGPQGLAIGPSPQILLGCSGVGTAPYALPLTTTAPGSVVISAIDGSTITSLPFVNGVDEVWYNSADNSYFLAGGNQTFINNQNPGTTVAFSLVTPVDAAVGIGEGPVDFVVTLSVDLGDHSIAVFPVIAAGLMASIIYVPSPASHGCLTGFPCPSGGVLLLQPNDFFDDPAVVATKH